MKILRRRFLKAKMVIFWRQLGLDYSVHVKKILFGHPRGQKIDFESRNYVKSGQWPFVFTSRKFQRIRHLLVPSFDVFFENRTLNWGFSKTTRQQKTLNLGSYFQKNASNESTKSCLMRWNFLDVKTKGHRPLLTWFRVSK